jgi:hypothetical protein
MHKKLQPSVAGLGASAGNTRAKHMFVRASGMRERKNIMATQALAPMRMLLQKEVPWAHCQGVVYLAKVLQ